MKHILITLICSLMKIIKGDDSKKQIDNIVQQQLKVESSTDTSNSSKAASIFGFSKKPPEQQKQQSVTPTISSSNAHVDPSEKKTFFGNLFGPGAGGKQQQQQQQQQQFNRPIEQPRSEPVKQQSNITSNPLQQPQNPSQRQPNKGLDVNLKFDPTSNTIKGVGVSGQMDAETAKTIYDNNKQYLPTGAQVMSGLKSAYNSTAKFISETDKSLQSNQQQSQKKGFF